MRRVILLAFAMALVVGSHLYAAPTDNFIVRVQVNPICHLMNFGNGECDFGIYDPLVGASVDPCSVDLDVLCTKTTPFQIALDSGTDPDATHRAMTLGGGGPGVDRLTYTLYQDAGGATPWGDGATFGATLGGTHDGTGAGSPSSPPPRPPWWTYTVYGQMDADQWAVAPGNYWDTVTATVVF